MSEVASLIDTISSIEFDDMSQDYSRYGKRSVHSRSSGRSRSTMSSSFMMESPMISSNSRLLKPTLSFYIAKQKRMEPKDENEGDIWYSERNEKILQIGKNISEHKKYEHVQSKLFEPTQSFVSLTKPETKPDTSVIERAETPFLPPPPKAINENSRILQPTKSFTSKVDPEYIKSILEAEKMDSESVTEARLMSMRTGPEVSSRLWATTAAISHGKWKSKQQLEEEENLKILEEKIRHSSSFKVSKPSSHLLTPTAAMKNARYRRADDDSENFRGNIMEDNDDQTVTSDATGTSLFTNNTVGRKVRETSLSLLRPTASQIHAKYKPPESPVKPVKVAAAINLRDHLIQPTAGLENAKYKKPPEPDPREVGWRAYGSRKLSEASFTEKDLPSPILVTSKRVKETSGRLTTPNRYQRWRGSMSNDSVPEVNLNKIKPISPDDHLLTPAKKEKPVVVDLETKTEKKKIAKPSEHLLTLTIANEHSKYVKPEDRVVEEEEDDIETISIGPSYKVKETSSRVLSMTAAYENHRRPEPEPPKPLPAPVSSNEHFLTPTLSYKIATSITDHTRRGVMFTINEDGEPSSIDSPKLPPPVSPNARFLSPTTSFRNKTSRNLGDLWIDAISSNSSLSGRSVSPSVSSISTSTISSSVNVKHLVKVFSVRAVTT